MPKSIAIEQMAPTDLKPYARNARTHSVKQIAQIAASIRTFGFNNPVLIDKHNVIIAGHGRVEAAKLLGLETVPVIRLEHLSEAEKRAYILADNKLAEKAGWDAEILAIELQNLIDLDLDFDISVTGFDMPEIDVLIGDLDATSQKPDPADAVPEVTARHHAARRHLADRAAPADLRRRHQPVRPWRVFSMARGAD